MGKRWKYIPVKQDYRVKLVLTTQKTKIQNWPQKWELQFTISLNHGENGENVCGSVGKTLAKTIKNKEDFGPLQLKKISKGRGATSVPRLKIPTLLRTIKTHRKKNSTCTALAFVSYSVQGNASSSVKSALFVGVLQARAGQNKLSRRHKQPQGVGTPASHFAPPTPEHLPCSGST